MNCHLKIKSVFKHYINEISPMIIELLEDELNESNKKKEEADLDKKMDFTSRYTWCFSWTSQRARK